MPKASSKSKVGRPRKDVDPDQETEGDAEELIRMIREDGGGEIPGPSSENPRIVDLGEDGDDTAGVEEAEAAEEAESRKELIARRRRIAKELEDAKRAKAAAEVEKERAAKEKKAKEKRDKDREKEKEKE